MKLREVLDYLSRIAPLELAASWDNVGLLLGDGDAQIKRVMTCLTVTPAVVAEAVAEKVELIVTHHPVLFRGVKNIVASNPEGRMLLELARTGIAVYSAHTAYDNAAGGINDKLAAKLELKSVEPLRRGERKQLKVVVFTPESDLGKVSDAMFSAGAGRIGQYNECSFRIPGTGTFFATDATNPTVGQKGRREEVAEHRLEVICPDECLGAVISAMRKAHSYEEPAFDVYPLRPSLGDMGEGRVGVLSKKMSLAKLAKLVQKELSAGMVQTVGDAAKLIEKVAIVCGAGGEFLPDANKAKADVFLTGEMRFHDCLAAEAAGMCVLLPGHYATERIGMEEMAKRLQDEFRPLKVLASKSETDPLAHS